MVRACDSALLRHTVLSKETLTGGSLITKQVPPLPEGQQEIFKYVKDTANLVFLCNADAETQYSDQPSNLQTLYLVATLKEKNVTSSVLFMELDIFFWRWP